MGRCLPGMSGGIGMFNNLRFSLINWAFDKNIFGIKKKCWAHLVGWSGGMRKFSEIENCHKCGYCGRYSKCKGGFISW